MSSEPAGVDFRFSGKTDLQIGSVNTRDVQELKEISLVRNVILNGHQE
jgi:hypothetical protein